MTMQTADSVPFTVNEDELIVVGRKPPWTDEENHILVKHYVKMMRKQRAGEVFDKTEFTEQIAHLLPQRYSDRLRGKGQQFRRKLCDISGAVKALGEQPVDGIAPGWRFQASLLDIVAHHLKKNRHELDTALEERMKKERKELEEREERVREGAADDSAIIEIADPRLGMSKEEIEMRERIAEEYEVVDNKKVGDYGERIGLHRERFMLREAGRPDLAERVIWTAKQGPLKAGYDIESFNPDGSPRLIEVKSTIGHGTLPFSITGNEMDTMHEKARSGWCLLRIYEICEAPRAFEMTADQLMDRNIFGRSTTTRFNPRARAERTEVQLGNPPPLANPMRG